MQSFKNLVLAGVAAIGLGVAAPSVASAATIQLGFIIDESGSISGSDFATIRTGLANAINNLIPVGGVNSYEISVVKFDNTAETVVNRVLVNSIAARTGVANQILAMGQQGGTTNFAAAFNLMKSVLTTGANLPTTSYVNFATDGQPNVGGNGVAERDLLIAAGIDNISIEGIGGGVDAAFLKNSICYPGPCDDTSPYNFPSQGFYLSVANAAAYEAAISNKILIVTQQTPEPATMAILGVGLLGLGIARRRRAA